MKKQVEDYEERDDFFWPHYTDMIYDHIEDLNRLWEEHMCDFELIKKWMSLSLSKGLSMLMEADATMARMGNRMEYIKTTQVAFFFIGHLSEMHNQVKLLKDFQAEASAWLNYKEAEKSSKYVRYSRDLPFKRPETLFDGIIPDAIFDKGDNIPITLEKYRSIIWAFQLSVNNAYLSLERLTDYVLETKEDIEKSDSIIYFQDYIDYFMMSKLYQKMHQDFSKRMSKEVDGNEKHHFMQWFNKFPLVRSYIETSQMAAPLNSEFEDKKNNLEAKRVNAIVLKAISNGPKEWTEFLTCLSLYNEIQNGLCISKELPEVFNNPAALSLLKSVQRAGMLDNQWQPAGEYKKNKRKASVLAFIIGRKLNLSPLWTPFEKLWGRKNMRNDFDGAQTAKKYSSIQKEIEEIISKE